MQRYKCTISYDGTLFSGYQIQPNARTVQSVMEAALMKIHKGQAVKVTASGRTDAGVHAKGQVIHFDSPLIIPDNKWRMALQSQLPEDISVIKVEKIHRSFHARFDAKGKEYRYFIKRTALKDPFSRNYQYHYSYELDKDSIQEAAHHLMGTHDFTSFCSAKTEVEDRIRTIKEIEIVEDEDTLMFRFVGNGFLYNMVRILVGTLLEVGRGLRKPEEMLEILHAKDRNQAGKTAPPHGLYLWKVHYESD
ncbi:tRNA pseudouridine(38-40) synthase TruA [Niallia sp. Krafla_26]|uniref:tRNA pseudouridine(38-40) synthase TruA n=1 Tax=Niallia sp. Krafla_26 TaxID=3064703 RepID=UPI003D174124